MVFIKSQFSLAKLWISHPDTALPLTMSLQQEDDSRRSFFSPLSACFPAMAVVAALPILLVSRLLGVPRSPSGLPQEVQASEDRREAVQGLRKQKLEQIYLYGEAVCAGKGSSVSQGAERRSPAPA